MVGPGPAPGSSSSLAHSGWGRRPPGEPLILAHRGASAAVLENTLEAFARARADGADGIELDVLACASGEVVVFHDDDLGRLAGRPERVGDLTLAALREVSLQGGLRIPTLEEAIEACGPTLLVNVELKGGGLSGRGLAALVAGVDAVVRRAGAAGRVLVSSFSPLAVYLWRRRTPAVQAALLFERGAPLPLRRAWAAPLLRPLALHPEAVLCTPGRVRGWHARGYAVNVWTVDDPVRLRALRDMGVDGVIANDPRAARAALAG
jgi:glycerophosphoryl diester phosphodiesterase